MLKSNWFIRLVCSGLLLFATNVKAQTGCGRMYVDSAVNTSGNGNSWATAFKTLTQALDSANSGTCSSREIWVRKGTYYPMQSLTTVATNRDSSFRILRNGIKLYGGFAGGETVLSARNVVSNPTILSGDIGVVGNNADNSYHVVTVVSINTINTIDSTTRLDGFTINKGNANETATPNSTFYGTGAGIPRTRGGGMYNHEASLTITNCIFSFNLATLSGGGLFNYKSSSFISKCTFSFNNAQSAISPVSSTGGGMVNYQSSPVITNCTFSSNTTSGSGGGVYNTASSAASTVFITNCTFSSNIGGGMESNFVTSSVTNCTFFYNNSTSGGAIRNDLSPSTITNCTFYANSSSSSGGAIDNRSGGTGSITNCIFWANTAGTPGGGPDIHQAFGQIYNINYSTTQTAQSGTGNSTANPLFLNTANLIGPDGLWRTPDDGLQLQAGSPAINAGSNAAIPAGITTDIMDSIRIRQGIVDQGAYESVPFACPAGSIVYVDSSRTLSGDGASWATAYKTLSQGLYTANTCAAVAQVWVAKGTYRPMQSLTGVAGSRDSSFRILRNGIKMYGGFAGNETSLLQRNIAANPTILSGDIGVFGNTTDDCYHVVTIVSNNTIDSNTRLDGFTISKGNANGGSVPFVVAGKNIYAHSGGGISVITSSPLLNNCTFTSNRSNSSGGGLYNAASSPFVWNCTFTANQSDGLGGGIANSYSLPSIANCVFFFNSSSTGGGGISNDNSTPSVTNCTFVSNSSAAGGGISNATSSSQITNCILWGNSSSSGPDIYNSSLASNPVISYSTTSALQPGTGNSTANPLFINGANAIGPDGRWGTSDDGLRLTTCSPAINAGNNAAVPAGITTDITGAARIQNTTVDKGAYEMPYNSTGISVTTISRSVANPVCSNTVITFTASATVPGSLPAYQWYKNGVAAGNNQSTYTFNSWNNGDSVWVVHTNNDCSVNDTSAKSIIQRAPVPAVTGAIAGNATPCPGTQTYSVGAVAGATTYTWTVPAGWTITAGQGTTSITVTSTNASGNVTVLAANACLVAPAVSTLAVTSFTTPVLPTGPTAVCGSSTGNVYSIPAILGATSYTWSVPAGWIITAGQGTNVIAVTAAAGNTSGNVSVQASNVCPTSGAALLAVTGGSVVPALIVGSNSDDTVCVGTLVVFTATPINGGTAPSFQWKKNGVNVGTNSPLYSTTALATGDVVTVTFTSNSPCATVPTITSSGPPIVVVPFVTPGVSINGAAGIVLCVGSSYTFTSGSTAGGSAPKYQWYKNGVAIPGATIATYTGANFTSNDAISVRLISNATCRTLDTVRSNSVIVTVIPNVVPVVTVTANPGTSVPAGSAVTFTANVTVGANNATYQWYKNGVAITSATSSTYTSNTLQGGDLIWVQVAALGPCATPNNLTSAPLRISRPAGIQTVSGGGSGNWQESLSLHPNPNTGRFRVSADWGTISAGERVWVEVVNNLGQSVFGKEAILTAGTWRLDIELNENAANGTYLLRLVRGSNTVTRPVLLER